MKRTYKLLGYLLLGIGAYAFINANNSNSDRDSSSTHRKTTAPILI